MDRVKRIWYLSPMRAAKVQASLRIRAVSPEPSLLAHTSSESRGTFRQKARSLAPLNGWACAVKICHDGMLEDTNSLGGAHIYLKCLLAIELEFGKHLACCIKISPAWLHVAVRPTGLSDCTHSLNGPCLEKTHFLLHANNKDTDQPEHLQRLISVFVIRCQDSLISLVSISEIQASS